MAFTLVLASLPACGYRFQGDMSQERLTSGDLPAVAVLPFDNLSFRRGLEIRLTRLLDDEVRSRSPRAAQSAESADWLLQGVIRYAGERVYSDDEQGRVRENSFILTVEVTLKNRSTEEMLGTRSFTTREPYSDRAGRISTLEEAEGEALRDLAEAITYWLEGRNVKEAS
ncbi:MAG: LPS assembly lipoprotein LptE [Planctomycetota bacterium]|jgi:outer membrane lipopolysaccharide assembly protein LptE/RlpB